MENSKEETKQTPEVGQPIRRRARRGPVTRQTTEVNPLESLAEGQVEELDAINNIESPSDKKLEELTVADGKDNDPKELGEIKDLEDLLGVKQVNPFRTTSEATLTERMSEMNLSDLQAFAVRIGILPSGNRLALKNKIQKAFKSHAGAGAGYNIGYQQPLVDPSSDAAQEILKISRENF